MLTWVVGIVLVGVLLTFGFVGVIIVFLKRARHAKNLTGVHATQLAASEGELAVSEHHLAASETELAASEERFRNVIEHSLLGMMRAELDGTIVMANNGAARIFGFDSPEELMKVNSHELVANPENQENVIAQIKNEGPVNNFESEIKRRDGSTGQTLGSVVPVYESGEVVAFETSFLDITNRLSAQRMYQGLLEAAADPVVIVNSSGTIVRLCRQLETVFGYLPQELIGRQVEILCPQVADTIKKMEAPRPRHTELLDLVALRKDGTEFPVDVLLSPIEFEGEILVYVAIHDISYHKKVAAQLTSQSAELQRSNDELEQSAYVISHDLQEPLRTMTNYVELLERHVGAQLDEESAALMARVVGGTERMQALISALLEYARAGGSDVELAPVNTGRILTAVLDDMKATLLEGNALVTFDPLPEVMGDEVQLTQLFLNLIGNALKFRRGESCHVQISACRVADLWVFDVRDDGIGFEQRFADRIFQPFKRLHTRDEYPGTGIGLALCTKIVERHGGTISVESEPGIGSTFTFSLLAVSNDDQLSSSSPIPTSAASN